ncbi:MAG: lasso peptide biosynthesis PqqD family chaperone [Longimicrobiales bacterium]
MKQAIRIEDGTVIVQSREPVAVDMEDTVVMMSLERGKYYGLDKVGSRIWELVSEPVSVRDLCATLEAEFEVDAVTCARDVREFLAELASEQLIRIVDARADSTGQDPIG